MTVKIFLKIFVFFLFVISCKRVKEDATPMWNPSKSDVAKWRDEALTKGDTNAYYNLSLDYMDSPYESFLDIALTMANKYYYHLAFSDAYDCLIDVDRKPGDHELKPLNEKTRELAIDILKRGAKKGNRECQHKLGELYLEGVYLEKNIEEGNRLIKKSE